MPEAPRALAGRTHTSEPLPKVDLGQDGSQPPLPTQFRDPQRYHFLGEHGRGGIGRVSRAHDRELGRDVAIKELLSRNNANEVRFLREVLITARLEHPGIVPVHEAGRWADGTPFYAMKLVAGRPLRDLIAERTTVEDRLGLLHHVIAIADAIAYAHGRNIIHRDLKPANVIVGDFGETIVIDWGLAKDLTTDEVASSESAPFQTDSSEELSSAGSVVGTRAYMAPEQERGEPVDQRADVFAIGMMLWELCSLRKVPPTQHLRSRALRNEGIDADLITIIHKALEPDPAQRYRDAGALAADLKAFKAGARIAARNYSLLAVLAHWTRRHRAAALSIAAAIVVAVTGSTLYIRNIAIERDRADASEVAAKKAQGSAEASLDELTLKHGELLLTKDPTAAIDVLAGYHGADLDRADRLRAEAAGLGVAFLRAQPHTDNLVWAQGTPDGAILSLGIDGTVARTTRDGKVTVLARGVSKAGIWAYAAPRRLLAYGCDPADVCLFDLVRMAAIPVAGALHDANVTSTAFSRDGNLFAMMTSGSVLKILDITDPAQPTVRLTKPTEGGLGVSFVSDDIVAVGGPTGVEFVRLTGESERIAFPGIVSWDADTSAHELVLAGAKGEAVILQSFPAHVTERAELCHGPIIGLKFVPGRRSAAYACSEGAIGLWDLKQHTVNPRTRFESHADAIDASASGDYVVAAGGNGTVMVIDLQTDLIATYRGHSFRLTAITPPNPGYPFVISGDVRGGLRAWPLPSRLARVAATASSRFEAAIFDAASTTVVATTWEPALTVVSATDGARKVEPHAPGSFFIERSASGKTFATYNLKDVVEVWSFDTMTRTRVLTTGHGSVSQLHFVDGSEDFVTAGSDGRLVRWTLAGEQTLVTQFDRPIDKFALTGATGATGATVFSTVDGALWRTDLDGHAVSLRKGGTRVGRLLPDPVQHAVYAGYESGDVIAVNTTSWQQDTLLHGAGAVREIAITGDSRTIAVATNDDTIHVGTRQDANPSKLTWAAYASRARYISLAPDGLVLASYTDGTIWLYSPSRRHWLCLPTGTLDLGRTAVTADGKAAVVLASEGRLIWVDLDAARKQIALTS